MGIAEDIRKTIQSRLVIRYCTDEMLKNPDVSCIVCDRKIKIAAPMCMYIRGEGHVCTKCAKRYAPEMTKLMASLNETPSVDESGKVDVTLSSREWKEINTHLNVLLRLTVELSRGISRGIVEAPSGHIGLMHLARNIGKPVRKENESDKDYELRLKSHRMVHLFDKIKGETHGRIISLQKYFTKLGMPRITDSNEDSVD